MLEKLSFLYGQDEAHVCFPQLERVMQLRCAYRREEFLKWESASKPTERFSEKDAILICYGDMIRAEKRAPLTLLTALGRKYFRDAFNTMHILALFPYSSDRGFAITDFEQINPEIGSWEGLRNLNTDFRLIVDSVFNHMSSRSAWFQEYLKKNPDFQAFFHSFPIDERIPEEDLRLVVRPRTSDLLTPFGTLENKRLVWTTFGPDQVDLNFKNPRVLLKVIEVLLLYVRGGCEIIRLDAVNYLWKELGTTCVHFLSRTPSSS